ncbi:MAG: hypothetical protein R3F24_14380 [Gammaproteobacteria bacterium]
MPPPTVPPDLNGPGTGEYYLQKRADFLLAKAFNRNNVSLNLFYSDEVTLDETVPTDGDHTRQTGLSAVWVYSIGARTRTILDGYYAKRKFSRVSAAEEKDNLFRLRLGLSYQLGERTDLTGWVSREERSGSEVEFSNYTENQVGLAIGRTF